MVSMMVMCSFTSCAKSLSPLLTITSMPCEAAVAASVPITSSASTPGTSSTFQPSRRTDFVDGRDLAAQIVGHRVAVGFVLGVNVVAESRAFGIEHAGHIVGRVFLAQAVAAC